MAIFYTYAKMKEFKTSAWNILGVVVFVNLLMDPSQLFNLSFQLSFGAVAGILYSYGQLQSLVKNSERVQIWRQKKWIRWGSDYVAVSMGGQMGTFLPIAFVFGHAIMVTINQSLCYINICAGSTHGHYHFILFSIL